MIPRELWLPDSLRDALQQAIDTQLPRKRFSPEGVEASRRIVAEYLFPEHPPRELATFLYDFQDRIAKLQDGSGAPVFVLSNLPTRHGDSISRGIAEILEGAHPSERSFVGRGEQRRTYKRNAIVPHMDEFGVYRDLGTGSELKEKAIRVMHCHATGRIQPTTFATADEAIDLLARERVRDKFSRSLDEARATVIKSLGNKIAKNPNYDPDTRACEYFVTYMPENPDLYPQYKELNDAAFRAVIWNSQGSPASTQPNSCAIWNDQLIMHGRGRGAEGFPWIRSIENWTAKPAAQASTYHEGLATSASFCDLPKSMVEALERRQEETGPLLGMATATPPDFSR